VSTLYDMLKKSTVIAIIALHASCLLGVDYKTLIDKVEDYSESNDLEQFLALEGQYLEVTGYAFDWKGPRSFILIERVESHKWDSETMRPIKTHSHEVKAFARISELADWPKEYDGKQIRLIGKLKKEQRKTVTDKEKLQSTEPLKQKDNSLFPWTPSTEYYFEQYRWGLIEIHIKAG